MKNFSPKFKILTCTFALCFLTFALVRSASAATSSFNKEINYQGKLTDSSGVLVGDGDYNIIFRIYTASSGGGALWTEVHTSTTTAVTVTNGLFSVLLGDITSLSSLNYNQDLYLGVSIGGTSSTPVWDNEMTPRKQFGTVPAAFEADRLDGIDSDGFIRSDIVGTSTGGLLVTASSTIQYFSFINATGTAATTTRLHVSGATTTQIANGVNLAAGCFAINGTCVGGSGITGSGAANRAAFWTTASNLSSDANFIWDDANDQLQLNSQFTIKAASAGAGYATITNQPVDANTAGVWRVLPKGTPTAATWGIGAEKTFIDLFGTDFVADPSNYDRLIILNTADRQAFLTGFFGSSIAKPFTFGQINENTAVTTEWFRIATSGNIGIGTTSPYAALSVVGSTGVVADHYEATGTMATSSFIKLFAIAATTSNLNVYNLASTTNLIVSGWATTSALASVSTATSTFANGINLSAGRGCFAINSVCVGTIPATSISKWATSSVDLTAIYPAGATKVGISTTTPMSALSVTAGNIIQMLGDTATTSTMILLDTVALPTGTSRLTHMSTFGRYLFGATVNGELVVYEISPTASTTLVSTTSIAAAPNNFSSYGHYAYISYGTVSGDDLEIWDMSNPRIPIKIGGIDTGGSNIIRDAVVSGGLLFVAGSDSLSQDIMVYDITNPANPVFVSGINESNAQQKVEVFGKYLFSSLFGGDVGIYDITNPNLLKKVGSLDVNASATQIEVRGRYAYVTTAANAGANEIRIFDIQNINSPVEIGGVEVGADAERLIIAGKYMYVSFHLGGGFTNAIRAYDISDPYNPRQIGSTNEADAATGHGIALMGRYLISAESALHIFDTTGIEAQSVVAHNLEAGAASVINGLTVGGRLYVGSGLTVGGGGIGSYGPGIFSTYSTSTIAIFPSLRSTISDTFRNSVSDALDIGHMATSSLGVASGIGSALTFSVQDNATTSSTTARIAGVLTNTSTTSPKSVLTFSTKNSSVGLTEWMRLTSSGYLGISTTSPYASLSVVGESGVVADKYFATSTIATSTFAGILSVGTTSPSDGQIFAVGDRYLSVQKNNGLVRIGTTTATLDAGGLVVQGAVCITAGTSCPISGAGLSMGGLAVDTSDQTPDADDIGEVFDIGERYPASEVMEAGDIASLDTGVVDKAVLHKGIHDEVLIGVVSTAPAIGINGSDVIIGPGRQGTSTRPIIALVGRVPVKVNLDNGPISKGDWVSAGSEPGVGKKANEGEAALGVALEDWNNEPEKEGKVLVFVNLRNQASPAQLTVADSIKKDSSNWSIDESGTLRVKRLEADEVVTDKLCVEDICVTRNEFKSLLEASGASIDPGTDTASEIVPEPDIIPEPEVVSEPEVMPEVVTEPIPEPIAEPVQEPAPDPVPDPAL